MIVLTFVVKASRAEKLEAANAALQAANAALQAATVRSIPPCIYKHCILSTSFISRLLALNILTYRLRHPNPLRVRARLQSCVRCGCSMVVSDADLHPVFFSVLRSSKTNWRSLQQKQLPSVFNRYSPVCLTLFVSLLILCTVRRSNSSDR